MNGGAHTTRTGRSGDDRAGRPRLRENDIAKRLLASTIPARYGYTALAGTPRIAANWFAWTGEELVLPTFISAPHSHRWLRRIPAVACAPR
jgi:hypothetical protein